MRYLIKAHSMADKIGKLCLLLEDVDQPGTSTTSDQKHRQNIKVMIFQLSQRLDDLEHRQLEMQQALGGEASPMEEQPGVLLPAIDAANAPPSALDVSSKEPPGSARGPVPQPTLRTADTLNVKGLLTKHEMALNEVNLRLSDLEGGMQKLDPNSIRALIKDISELVMQEERKEVSAEMSNIKGSQKHSAQLVDVLKEELKRMDERFKEDIEKKIEKKDLYTAKTQLRRRVPRTVISLDVDAGAGTEAEGSRPWLGHLQVSGTARPLPYDDVQLQVLLLQPRSQK
jgi:hypothetical protein